MAPRAADLQAAGGCTNERLPRCSGVCVVSGHARHSIVRNRRKNAALRNVWPRRPAAKCWGAALTLRHLQASVVLIHAHAELHLRSSCQGLGQVVAEVWAIDPRGPPLVVHSSNVRLSRCPRGGQRLLDVIQRHNGLSQVEAEGLRQVLRVSRQSWTKGRTFQRSKRVCRIEADRLRCLWSGGGGRGQILRIRRQPRGR